MKRYVIDVSLCLRFDEAPTYVVDRVSVSCRSMPKGSHVCNDVKKAIQDELRRREAEQEGCDGGSDRLTETYLLY